MDRVRLRFGGSLADIVRSTNLLTYLLFEERGIGICPIAALPVAFNSCLNILPQMKYLVKSDALLLWMSHCSSFKANVFGACLIIWP